MKYLIYLVILANLISCSQAKMNPQLLKVASGTVERIEDFKSQFVLSRNIDVWLPDDYSAHQKYAVLYMHDGQMLFDSATTWNKQEWAVDETMGQLLKDQKIRNTIVVGIWNTERRHSEYFPQKPFESLDKNVQDSLHNIGANDPARALFKTKVCSDDYLKFVVKELKPFIDSKYSTLTDASNTFIAGSSMGGLISLYAVCEYPEVFQGAACLSTHWVGTFDTLNNPIPASFEAYLDKNLPEAKSHSIYFDYGTETLDALYEPYQMMIDSVMVRHEYGDENWQTIKFDGENHSENAWKKRLHIPLEFLLKK